MARKTITLKEFKRLYGYDWQDIYDLGWLEDISEDCEPCYIPRHPSQNDCPATLFLTEFAPRGDFEVYENSAKILAEIIKSIEENGTPFHLFAKEDYVYKIHTNGSIVITSVYKIKTR